MTTFIQSTKSALSIIALFLIPTVFALIAIVGVTFLVQTHGIHTNPVALAELIVLPLTVISIILAAGTLHAAIEQTIRIR